MYFIQLIIISIFLLGILATGWPTRRGKMIYLLIIIAIIGSIIFYKITNSILATVLYGVYSTFVIYITSLLLV